MQVLEDCCDYVDENVDEGDFGVENREFIRQERLTPDDGRSKKQFVRRTRVQA